MQASLHRTSVPSSQAKHSSRTSRLAVRMSATGMSPQGTLGIIVLFQDFSFYSL